MLTTAPGRARPSGYSYTRGTRFLISSRRAVGPLLASTPLYGLPPLPRCSPLPRKCCGILSAQRKPRLLCKAIALSQAAPRTSAPMCFVHPSPSLPTRFTYLSSHFKVISASSSIPCPPVAPHVMHNTCCVLHKCSLNAEVHSFLTQVPAAGMQTYRAQCSPLPYTGKRGV